MAKIALECGLRYIRVDRSEWPLSSRVRSLRGGIAGDGGGDGAARRRVAGDRGSGPGGSGSRTKAQVRAVPSGAERDRGPRSSRRSRPRSECRRRAGRGRRRRSRPARAAGEHPVHRQHAGGDPDLLGGHRRHRRGRHRRVDEAEGDPEQQVAGEQQAVGAVGADLGQDERGRRTAQAIPTVIRRRAPKRPISRPENGEMKIIGTVIGRISRPLSDRPSGRARPGGTGAGRTSPPSRRRPGRRRRRWRRSRGRCGTGRSRRSAPPTRCSTSQKAVRARRPRPRRGRSTVAGAQACDLDQGEDDRGEPDAERRRGPASRSRGPPRGRSTPAPPRP